MRCALLCRLISHLLASVCPESQAATRVEGYVHLHSMSDRRLVWRRMTFCAICQSTEGGKVRQCGEHHRTSDTQTPVPAGSLPLSTTTILTHPLLCPHRTHVCCRDCANWNGYVRVVCLSASRSACSQPVDLGTASILTIENRRHSNLGVFKLVRLSALMGPD